MGRGDPEGGRQKEESEQEGDSSLQEGKALSADHCLSYRS